MKNCSSKDHSEAKAITYCIECKIYMCNKCESFHSKLFSYVVVIVLLKLERKIKVNMLIVIFV